MLKRFQVSNFKQFQNLDLDFSRVRSYDFSTDCLLACGSPPRHFVKTALVYGKNSSGKSNLGLAVFDIVLHLVDRFVDTALYRNYLHANEPDKPASFAYTFLFAGKEVVYGYEKLAPHQLIGERLLVDGEEVFSLDNRTGEGSFGGLRKFGFGNLNNLYKDSRLSFLRYIANNSPLAQDSPVRHLVDFVGSMLWFTRSDRANAFIGLETLPESIESFIVGNNLAGKFQDFLHDHSVCEELCVLSQAGTGARRLFVNYRQPIPFFETASSGTSAMATLFYWRQKISKASFVFIDEFDAFYHHEVAQKVFEFAKGLPVQCVLTTHNTFLLDHSLTRPDCCLLLKDARIQPFSSLTRREIREGNNLEKLYLSHEFDA